VLIRAIRVEKIIIVLSKKRAKLTNSAHCGVKVLKSKIKIRENSRYRCYPRYYDCFVIKTLFLCQKFHCFEKQAHY
jgi:hypothetical protein